VDTVEKGGDGVLVQVSSAGQTRVIETDMAVHSAGRVPEIDDLDLETGGVAREKLGVTVNEYLQSVSNPAVYAAQDDTDARTSGKHLALRAQGAARQLTRDGRGDRATRLGGILTAVG
jgi:pyruvate/2-oxoglutarate dehydrogenase complex dihydrolipoamide dehydrogenase (E3) component